MNPVLLFMFKPAGIPNAAPHRARRQRPPAHGHSWRAASPAGRNRRTRVCTPHEPAWGIGFSRSFHSSLTGRGTCRAVHMTPDGVLVASRDEVVREPLLEDGGQHRHFAGKRCGQVSGEVILPKAVSFDASMKAENAVQSAGGFTGRAEDSVLVARMNGEAGLLAEMGVRTGSRIFVMSRVNTRNFERVSPGRSTRLPWLPRVAVRL